MKRRSWIRGVLGALAPIPTACARRDEPPEPGRPQRPRPSAQDAAGGSGAPGDLVLVELFSSEGCSSCPRAEALLHDLDGETIAERRVVVLEYHVDYWDDLGWRDPFSHARYTDRQRAYAGLRGGDSVFTPEAVVDGRTSVLATRRADLTRAIASPEGARPRALAIAVENDRVDVVSADAHEGLILTVVTGERGLVSRVRRGENEGRTLAHGTVVRDVQRATMSPSGTTSFSILSSIEAARRVVVAAVTAANGTRILALGAAQPMKHQRDVRRRSRW